MSSSAHIGQLARLALILAVVVGGIAWSVPAAAQVSATVSPSLLELQADPGASGEQEITMDIGGGDDDVVVTAQIVPYDVSVSVPSAVDWLSLDSDEIGVGPDESATFTLSIEIPEDTATGGHYAAVILTMGAAASTETPADGASVAGQASVQGRFIIPVLIRVGEEDDYERSATLGRLAPILEPEAGSASGGN